MSILENNKVAIRRNFLKQIKLFAIIVGYLLGLQRFLWQIVDKQLVE
jgi:hypothetical protein